MVKHRRYSDKPKEDSAQKEEKTELQELFDAQPEDYKEKILERNNLIVSLEAGNSLSWNKYLKENDISFGINSYGKSAPYKDLFENFNLTSNKIVSQIQRKIRK